MADSRKPTAFISVSSILQTQWQWRAAALLCAGSINVSSRESKNLQTNIYPCYSEDIYEQSNGKTATLQEYCTQQDIQQGGKNETLLERNFEKFWNHNKVWLCTNLAHTSAVYYIPSSCFPFGCLFAFKPAQHLVEDSMACFKPFAWIASLQNKWAPECTK